MKPLVCAIIVNYNGIEDTTECVKSLKLCSYDNIRIIIVDNASSNGKANYNAYITTDICEIIYNSDNIGFAGANNVGIKRALEIGAEYLLILNNDTVVEKNFLQPLIEAFKCNKNLGIATGKIYYYDDPDYLWFGGSHYDSKLMEYKISGIGEKDAPEYNIENNIPFATGCLWLLSRETVNKVGLMSEEYFLYYEDADYCEKMKMNGLGIRYIPESIIYHKESRSTRKGSDYYKYYNLRNYLIFIKRYRTKGQAFKLMTKRFFKMLKDIMRRRLSLRIVWNVWRDFIGENYGRKEWK